MSKTQTTTLFDEWEQIGYHFETIVCPCCRKAQRARVYHTTPWNTYLHTCHQCGTEIGESEWQVADDDAIADAWRDIVVTDGLLKGKRIGELNYFHATFLFKNRHNVMWIDEHMAEALQLRIAELKGGEYV